MKAYVVTDEAHVYPFRRAAHSFRLGDDTVGARLRRQLVKAGFEVTEAASFDDGLLGPGLALRDNVVLADATVGLLREYVLSLAVDAPPPNAKSTRRRFAPWCQTTSGPRSFDCRCGCSGAS